MLCVIEFLIIYPQLLSKSKSKEFRANMDSKVQFFSPADEGVDQLHASTLQKTQ